MSGTLEIATPTTEQELAQLPALIQTWKQVKEELQTLEDQRKEKRTRVKALEEVIMRMMKKYEIGTLDLKNSGGQLLYQKKQSKAGLSSGTLMKLLSDHYNSEEKAKETWGYISEHRGTKEREMLCYRKD
jgi:hypothetical protein